MLLKQATSGYLSQWYFLLPTPPVLLLSNTTHSQKCDEMRQRKSWRKVPRRLSGTSTVAARVDTNDKNMENTWHLTLLFLNEHIEHILNICLFFIFESPFKKSEQVWELSWSNNVRQLSFHTDENHKKAFVDAVRSYTLWISLTKSLTWSRQQRNCTGSECIVWFVWANDYEWLICYKFCWITLTTLIRVILHIFPEVVKQLTPTAMPSLQ